MGDNVKKSAIANTDVYISALSLGTVKFGRNQSVKYPSSFDLPNDKDLLLLLDHAKQLGINTLDTAPAYGIAEQRLGQLLKNQRKKWHIISKAGEIYQASTDTSHYDYSARALKAALDNSLRQLNTDYLDCWLLHSDGNDIQNLNDEAIHCLQQAKQQGLVRSIGMSTKTLKGGQLALQHLDCIMMTASLQHTEETPLFEYAASLNKSIILKKIYDSGWALQQADKTDIMKNTLQQFFQHTAVASAIIGTINPQHLAENVEAYQHATS